ncbi:hypothetical protein ACGFYO_16905 [Streptomyces sp. NPDC048201]|uniref:hypothetical protein n=1 Tax=Streptomyces sp. NPDC048201 TaxID=3365513 RepID=UPI0037146A21
MRLRLQVIGYDRRALALADTPRPDCPDCAGAGGIEQDYGDYDTGEYVDTDWYLCDCWTEWRRVLLPLPRLPRLLRRHVAHRDPWSDEPPF